MLTSLFLTGAAALALAGHVPAPAAPATGTDGTSWTIHAKKVYTSTGKVHENAIVVVKDGKIRAISAGVEAPRNALKADVVTAGLIDASARVNAGTLSVEQSSEITPTIDAAQSIDFFDARWKRLAKSGVTTAFVAPLNQAAG